MTKPANAVELGLMRGSPAAEELRVTLANWQDPPFSRWGFSHVRELIPTARIGRGDGPVVALEPAERDLMELPFEFLGERRSVAQMLDATFTDALLLGRVNHDP